MLLLLLLLLLIIVLTMIVLVLLVLARLVIILLLGLVLLLEAVLLGGISQLIFRLLLLSALLMLKLLPSLIGGGRGLLSGLVVGVHVRNVMGGGDLVGGEGGALEAVVKASAVGRKEAGGGVGREGEEAFLGSHVSGLSVSGRRAHRASKIYRRV